MTNLKSRGVICILSSPSGAGKTTIAKAIVNDHEIMSELSISYTTRRIRPGEKEGSDYYFITQNQFLDMIDKDQFLEHTQIYDNFYGTLKSDIIDKINNGTNIIFDIDWHGARSISKNFPEDVVKIFVMPPSMQILKDRLKKRSNGDQSHVAERIKYAVEEIKNYEEYDFIVVNDDLENTISKVKTIISSEKLRRNRLKDIDRFINSMILE